MTDLVKRLRIPLWNDETMCRWDEWRAKHKAGYSGSGTRDDFESLLDSIDDERKEAATALESLTAENVALKADRDRAEEKAAQWKYMSDRRADVCQQAIDQMNANLRLAEEARRANADLLQQRNEAFERAAKVADEFSQPYDSVHDDCVEEVEGIRCGAKMIATAIRNLSKES